MGAAWLLRRRTIAAPWVVLSFGVALFFAVGYAEDIDLAPGPSTATHAGYAVGAMLAILGLVETERQGRLHVPRIVVALGGASYAIYLTHLLAIGVVWKLLVLTRVDAVLPLGMEIHRALRGRSGHRGPCPVLSSAPSCPWHGA